jgi:hypothetical protein
MKDCPSAGATGTLTLADSSDILHAALVRSAERGRTMLALDAACPSSNVEISRTATTTGASGAGQEHARSVGDGHALVLWHTAG